MTLGEAHNRSVLEMVDEVRFQMTRLGNGYDMGAVDDLLDRVLREEAGAGDLASVLDGASLAQTGFLKAGYDVRDVDDFLDRLRSVAARR